MKFMAGSNAFAMALTAALFAWELIDGNKGQATMTFLILFILATSTMFAIVENDS